MSAGRAWQAAALLLLLAGAGWTFPHDDFLREGEARRFLAGLVVMSAGYLIALRVGGFSATVFWIVAVGLRLLLLGMEPGDDIFRYVWEGRVLANGVNPYAQPPNAPALAPLRDALWAKVGHPHCTAIYPPLAEIAFAVLAALGAGVTALKAVFLLADLGVCALLARRFGTARSLVYAWNPLALYCFAGGGHYDSLFILALVGAWMAWDARPRRAAPAIALAGVAVALKWMALPVLAWMGGRVWEAAGARRATALLVPGALPFALGWAAISAWTGEWTTQLAPLEFARHARSAEFLPALLDALTGVELVNDVFTLPLLAAWALVWWRCRVFAHAAEWCLFAAFVLSPMLHVWYFTWLLPFAAATRNRGSVALTVTGTLYFIMCHRIALGETWTLCWWERALIWLPFVAGFLWSRARPLRAAVAAPPVAAIVSRP
jgi:hypothetical protein